MPITYNNVPTATGGGAGTLFQNISFWVAQRVPNRNAILSNIQSNAGKLVALDKKATYLIADPAKDPPAGSYSYEWIQDSVDRGQLLPSDDYRINAVATAGRPTGATKQRSIRVPFTKEDKHLLLLWVIKHERAGFGTEGNLIFERLENHNKRHTWQSWRSHWITSLKRRPRPDVSEQELAAIPSPSSTPPPAPPQVSSAPRPSQPGPSASRATNNAAVQRAPTRAKFTREEDTILLNRYFDVVGDGEATKDQDLYRKLADDYPEHTFHSWKDRLGKTIEPKVRKQLETSLEHIGRHGIPVLVRWLHSQKSAAAYWVMVESEPLVSTTLAPAPAHVPEPVASPEPDEDTEPEAPHEAMEADEPAVEYADAPGQDEDAHTPGQLENAASEIQRSDTPPQAATSSPITTPTSPNNRRVEETIEYEDNGDENGSAKREFYTDYLEYLQTTRQTLVHFPSIAGRTFDLWELWSEVTAQKMDPAERDWSMVAENLGIDWVEHPDAPEAVQQFYQLHLALFEEALRQFEDSDGGETEAPSEAVLPSSPPMVRNSKRPSVDDGAVSPHDYSSPPRKRQKHARGSEIPSTPDEKNGTVHLRQSNGHFEAQNANEKEEEERYDEVPDLPGFATRRSPAGAAEPETQDFRYDEAPETQYYDATGDQQEEDDDFEVMDMGGDLDEDDEITPSQQLIIESDAVGPSEPPTSPQRQRAGPHPQGGTTPRRTTTTRTPFLMEDSDEEQTPRAQNNKKEEETGGSKEDRVATAAKRRSLPKSFTREGAQSTGRPDSPSPSGQQPLREKPQATKIPSRPATASGSNATKPTTAAATTTTAAAPHQPKVDDIINYHISLGYTREVVLKAMHATTWGSGICTIVMEELQKGNGIPSNAQGVWTAKDDEYLMLLVRSQQAGHDGPAQEDENMSEDKKKKRLERAKRRIEAKHTPQMIERRKKFLMQDEGSVWLVKGV